MMGDPAMRPTTARHAPVLTFLCVAALTFSCAEDRLDFPQVEGWAQTGETMIFDADNLWEYINGAAELFVEYGVQTVRTADLTSGGVTVTAELYDMGSPLNAFGVFQRERPEGSIPFPGATAAVISPPYQALLLKGNTYVKVNVFEGEFTDEGAESLLEGIAAALSGPTTFPEELQLLPADRRMSGTEGYKPEAFLGQTELVECIYADYVDDQGGSWEGFVVLPESSAQVWDAVAQEWSSVEHEAGTIRYTEIPYSGFVGMIMTDAGLMGVSGAADEAQMQERLSRLIG